MKIFLTSSLIFALALITSTTVTAQQKKIGMKRAQAIATSHAKGLRLEAKELEHENGTWIYSFEFKDKKGAIREVNVNAYTGKAVVEHESKKSEAAEEKSEKNEKN
jgi:uncharacterized membrane protein YkoI